MSHECNKFIIKNNTFIRNFEGMYREIDDPWGQEENHKNDQSTMAAFHFLANIFSNLNSNTLKILDIGCANGYHAQNFIDLFGNKTSLVGTDISKTVIKKAKLLNKNLTGVQFVTDDCRVSNPLFKKKFDLVFSSKTLYYVAPEIDKVVLNIKSYLKNTGGIFLFVYNQTSDAFSNKWLTYEGLREIVLLAGFKEEIFVELNRFSLETTAIGAFSLKD